MARFLGSEFRRLREQRGLTQRDLADLVGLSQAQISLHERGDDVPAPKVRFQYAEALGLTPEELEDLIGRDQLKESLRASTTLSQEAKRSIEDYIDFAWERDRQARADRPADPPGQDAEASGDGDGLP